LFKTELILKSLHSTEGGRAEYEVMEPLVYITKDNRTIEVPKGFITDLASVPRPFWALLPPGGKYSKAAVVHDYMYVYHYDKEYADKTFRDALKECGVGSIRRNIMYYAVKLFGGR
jgi:hypothetical protein